MQCYRWSGRSEPVRSVIFFFLNDTATTEIYTLSLHDALPISIAPHRPLGQVCIVTQLQQPADRSEEHTSELQSRGHLVCRLLLEKKKSWIFKLLPSSGEEPSPFSGGRAPYPASAYAVDMRVAV